MSEVKSNRAWREECESLRQQLACEFDKREALDNELAHREAQIVRLRGALKLCSGWVEAYGQPETRDTVRKALAATDDLKEQL